jgi:diacylglycerol kinase (ATP)
VTTNKKNIHFIINPFSGGGKGKKILPRIEQFLDSSIYEWDHVFTEHKSHATVLAKAAVQKDYDIIVAVGGDGTVNEVAAGLIHTDKVMGIIPAGSGNGLAMHLGLGRKAEKAIQAINKGKDITIDTCKLNDQAFVNLAGVGFDGLVALKVAKSTTRGFIGYLKEFAQVAWSYQPLEYEFFIDEKPFKEKYLFVEVANAPMFGYNFTVAPYAKLNDGLLEVVLVKKAPKWKYFGLIPRMLQADLNKSDLVERFTAKEVVFQLPENRALHIDGEGFFAQGEIRFSVTPLSLRVIVGGELSSLV